MPWRRAVVSPLVHVLVDWENLRITLHGKGYVTSPVTVLSSTLAALDTALGPAWRAGSAIELFSCERFETVSDTTALRANRDPAVKVRDVWRGKNMADFEIALTAVEHHFQQPSADLWIVSSDNDLALLVKRLAVFARRTSAAGVIGLLAHDTLPGLLRGRKIPGLEARSIKEPLEESLVSCIGPPLKRRRSTSWDRAAWVFRVRMATRMSDAVPSKMLLDAACEGGISFDWNAVAQAPFDDAAAEVVDTAVAGLWRESWGRPFPPSAARARLLQSVPQLAEDEATGLLAALAMAGLIRHRSADSLEVPSAWREGFLHPARRVVLFVASRDGARRDSALQRHRESLARPEGGKLSTRDKADAVDSFKTVVDTLTRRKVLEERVSSTLALKSRHPFVAGTKETAARVLEALNSPCRYSEAKQRVGELRISAPARWLRVLREVGLAERARDGKWRIGQLALRPPWADSDANGIRAR